MNDEGLADVEAANPNQRWCSDVFLIPCWSGEVISVAFAIDCHDREVSAFVASPRPLTGADIRTLMDRTLWARFGEATLKAPHAVQWLSDNGPQYTATATVLAGVQPAEQRPGRGLREDVQTRLRGWRRAPRRGVGAGAAEHLV